MESKSVVANLCWRFSTFFFVFFFFLFCHFFDTDHIVIFSEFGSTFLRQLNIRTYVCSYRAKYHRKSIDLGRLLVKLESCPNKNNNVKKEFRERGKNTVYFFYRIVFVTDIWPLIKVSNDSGNGIKEITPN